MKGNTKDMKEIWIMTVNNDGIFNSDDKKEVSTYIVGNSKEEAKCCVKNQVKAWLNGTYVDLDPVYVFTKKDSDTCYSKIIQYAAYRVEISAHSLNNIPQYEPIKIYKQIKIIIDWKQFPLTIFQGYPTLDDMQELLKDRLHDAEIRFDYDYNRNLVIFRKDIDKTKEILTDLEIKYEKILIVPPKEIQVLS